MYYILTSRTERMCFIFVLKKCTHSSSSSKHRGLAIEHRLGDQEVPSSNQALSKKITEKNLQGQEFLRTKKFLQLQNSLQLFGQRLTRTHIRLQNLDLCSESCQNLWLTLRIKGIQGGRIHGFRLTQGDL